MKSHCFFAHVAFAFDARSFAIPRATANLLIEINNAALAAGGKKRHCKILALPKLQKVELAGKIAKVAVRDYLRSEQEFRKYPAQRFVDFNPIGIPTYISIRPPPTRILPNDSKVWRLEESESDKLRTKPLPVTLGGNRKKE